MFRLSRIFVLGFAPRRFAHIICSGDISFFILYLKKEQIRATRFSPVEATGGTSDHESMSESTRRAASWSSNRSSTDLTLCCNVETRCSSSSIFWSFSLIREIIFFLNSSNLRLNLSITGNKISYSSLDKSCYIHIYMHIRL